MAPPYGKRARRYGRRRSSRALSTKSIYSNRSARSQANQIYALRKRVARIGRQIRPDIKVAETTVQSKTFNNTALANTYFTEWEGSRTVGTADDQRIGDKIYVKSFSVYATFEYANNFTAEPVTVEAKGGTVRMIVLQARTASGYGESLTDPTSIISGYSNSGSQYDLNTVSPLASGITKTWTVLRDMRFRIDDDSPVRQIVLRVKPKWRTLRYQSNAPEGGGEPVDNPNHGFFVFVCTSGLHWQSSVIEQISMSFRTKYTYTDM